MNNHQNSHAPRGGNRQRLLTIVLAVALLATWAYIIWDKNRVQNEKKQSDLIIANTSQERDELRNQLDDATSRYDILKTASSRKDSAITAKDEEIRVKKQRIETLLSKVNADKKELAEARTLIASLNTDIESFKQQIETLEGQKIVLIKEKEAVTGERDQLVRQYDSAKTVISDRENVIDVGSTLHVSSFRIEPINRKRSGKEVSTSRAKQTDKLRISFDIDENMIAPSGSKQLFIIITDPAGKLITDAALGSGNFTARDGRELSYTQRVEVNYVQNQRQTVNFEWQQASPFLKGNYRIEVYHNGFKIGEAVRPLS